MIKKKMDLSQEKTGLERRIDELDEEINKLQTQLEKLNAEYESLTKIIGELERWFEDFEHLLGLIEEEEKLGGEIDEAEKRVNDLTATSKKLEDEMNSLLEQMARLNADINTVKQQQEEMEKAYDQVREAHEAEITSGEWKALLVQYQELLKAQNADIASLKDRISNRSEQKAEYSKEISKRGCDVSLYSGVTYSENRERELRDINNQCREAIVLVTTQYTEAVRDESASKTNFDNACNGLEDYGGNPLPISEVGSDFGKRMKAVNDELKENGQKIKDNNSILEKLARMEGQSKSSMKKYNRPSDVKRIDLEVDYQKQFDRYMEDLDHSQKKLNEVRKNVEDNLEDMNRIYSGKSVDIIRAVDNLKSLLSNEMRGDRYFTLCEHITANIHTTELRISQIKTDLSDFDKSRQDLIRQCIIQGSKIYDGLKQMASSSKVKVYSKRVQMIKFDIPDAVDENVALQSITNEIEKGTQEIIRKMEEGAQESDIRKTAKTIVGSNVLLRRYIGSDKIVLKAYKIDQNPENSGYRTWEQTQINNSGAEKFVVYFAIILSLMSYSRNNYGDYGMDGSTSVLILDNPFGPISSKHVLEPMFEIAHHFMVQMICLSDISKSDIVSCFDLVIRAIVKKIPFSNKEQLTHPENEMIEHGYYKAEQMKLF